MKHQGIEGFTWDSKAEEWTDWCASVMTNDSPMTREGISTHLQMWGEYLIEYKKADIERLDGMIAALPVANQWSDPDPYRVISWRDYPPSGVNLWVPTVALILATVLVAWQAGYL